MKMKVTFFLVCLAGLLVMFSACKDDSLSDAPQHNQAADQVYDMEMGSYDKFGPKLENAISLAAKSKAFAIELAQQTQTMPTGDFEVLLSDFIEGRLMPEGEDQHGPKRSVKEFIIENAKGSFTAEELDNFLANYPSIIIGLRGDALKWLQDENYSAPVKFVSSTFDKKSQVIEATQAGNKISFDLTKTSENPIIALHISERHDYDGNPVVVKGATEFDPSVSANDVTAGQTIEKMCNPEPTACPSATPVITSFNATPENGAIKLTYSIANFPTTLCSWGRIKITRLNPNNTYTYFYRFANSPTVFFDNAGGPNVSYTYTIEAYVAYKDGAVPTPGNWVTCPTSNILTTSATMPELGPLIETFVGTNMSNTTIRYDWYPLNGAPISEYRLRKATTSGYQVLGTFNSSTFDYFYNHPSSDRGNLVEAQIQYKSGGSWQGNTFDRTHASFRNSGQPFRYYGLRMDDVVAFEYNESPIFGAPEVRLTAVQATASEQTITLANTFLPMSPCLVTETRTFRWGPFPWQVITFTQTTNTGYYFPTQAPSGYQILNSWSNALHGTAITVITKETDVHVPVITDETNTSSNETKVNASFGFKLFKVIDTKVGVESTWKNASEIKIKYPVSDLDLGEDIIYYHEHPTTVKGFQLFGNISGVNSGNICATLSNNL